MIVLILGSILGVQIGQKLGERIDGSEFKTILAILLLLVGIAMAYDSFFRQDNDTFNSQIIKPDLNTFSEFITKMSNEVPIVYGVVSIILAITLAVLAAFVRKLFSDYRKKKN